MRNDPPTARGSSMPALQTCADTRRVCSPMAQHMLGKRVFLIESEMIDPF